MTYGVNVFHLSSHEERLIKECFNKCSSQKKNVLATFVHNRLKHISVHFLMVVQPRDWVRSPLGFMTSSTFVMRCRLDTQKKWCLPIGVDVNGWIYDVIARETSATGAIVEEYLLKWYLSGGSLVVFNICRDNYKLNHYKLPKLIVHNYKLSRNMK